MRHTLPAASSDRASTMISATPSASSTASPPTASRIASCATMSKTSARNCCSVPDVSKIEILGAQDEKIFVEFSMKELASLGIDRSALIAALQAQNVVQPAGTIQTGNETLRCGSRAHFDPSRMCVNINFAVGGRMLRLSDIAQVRRGFADPPQPMFRVNGEPAYRPCHRHARRRRHTRAGQEHQARDGRDHRRSAARHRPQLVADQAVTVQERHRRIHDVAVAGDRHHPGGELHQSRRAPGLVIALAIPLTLAIVFAVMELARIDMQRISLGALIIALALLVDDAMTTTDAMLTRLAQGDDKVQAGDIRVPHLRICNAGRNAGDNCRLRAGRLCRQLCRRIHVFAICGRRHRANRVLVRGGDLRAVARRRPSWHGRPTAKPIVPAECCSGTRSFLRSPCGRDG